MCCVLYYVHVAQYLGGDIYIDRWMDRCVVKDEYIDRWIDRLECRVLRKQVISAVRYDIAAGSQDADLRAF